jgi:hypothetical protein
MLRIALGFSKNMHKYMLILCIFIHIFRNIMHKVDAYFSTSEKKLTHTRPYLGGPWGMSGSKF